MFNRILILRGVIEIGNSDVGRFVVKKNIMVIDYYTVLSMISSEILIYTFQNFPPNLQCLDKFFFFFS